VASYALVVLAVSLMPVEPRFLSSVHHLDKLAHLCEYLLFAWMLVQAVRAAPVYERTYLLWAWIYATSYGLLMELLQALVPWRTAEWGDAVANAIGAAIGVWVGQQIPRMPRKME